MIIIIKLKENIHPTIGSIINYSPTNRPTGKVEIPEGYPVQRLFECCRMWEEMLSVLVERFNGDSLLAYEEVS